eukprot:s802_g14.t1
MGRSGAHRKAPGKHEAKGKKGEEKKKHPGVVVQRYNYFAKSQLAAYPNEDGDFGEGMPEETRQKLRKTGIPEILEAFTTNSGKAFVQSLSVLNLGKTGRPEEKRLKKAVKVFDTYLEENKTDLPRHLARLASRSASLYLFSMTLLKDMALLCNPEKWAKKVEGEQRSQVKAWLKKPRDRAKKQAALLAEIAAKASTNDPAPGRKRRAGASSATVSSDADAPKQKSSSANSRSSSARATSASKSASASDFRSPPKMRRKSPGTRASKSKKGVNEKPLVFDKDDQETETD